MKCIINGRILMPDGVIDGKALSFDERITGISNQPPSEAELIDARGCYVTPGLVDVHCHGMLGDDACDGNPEALKSLSTHLVRHGVTSWLATTATLPWQDLERCFSAIRQVMRDSAGPDWDGAQVLGCHAEGPFINPVRRGGMNAQYILKPDARRIKPWADVIRLITVAPELSGALDFIREVRKRGICVSIGHSDATAAEAIAGIEAGAGQVTHTFNAMPPLNHRDPGLLGAAFNDERVYCELIADTVHVNPLLFSVMARLKPHRLVLVTDSVRCAGLPAGSYDLMGTRVISDGTVCRLEDGTLAGSMLTMDAAVRHFARHSGMPLWRVVNMASLYPARAIGVDEHKGALQRGKDADIVIADRDFNVRATFARGRRVYRADPAK